ncbi:MAG: DUF898 family protein [Paracoccaceae bacterium]
MAASTLRTDYAGKRGALLKLALWSSILTVLTIGFYRFWMKTRLRRYYWSAIRPGGQPLEYVGEPLEKLLGFLIAVTFLAFYIGIVNLLLMFLSFSIMNNNLWAYALSFIGILPILFYARYRARRYILARTRWRGVRFGMEQGAWGYSWRALIHWAITILSAGLLWPRMTFALEKYRTDRTFFGTERFEQGGRWQILYRAYLPFLAGLIIVAAGSIVIWQGQDIIGGLAISVGVLVAYYGFAHYRVHAFRILMNHKTVSGVGFQSRPRPWRVLWIYLFGYSLVGTVLTAFVIGFGFAIIAPLAFYGITLGEEFGLGDLAVLPFWLTTAISAFAYFAIFIIWGVLKHVLVTLPLARHYAETLDITGASNLSTFAQRDRDKLDSAEGFAEALDVGAAI